MAALRMLLAFVLGAVLAAEFGEREGLTEALVEVQAEVVERASTSGCTAHGDCGDTSFCASAAHGTRQCIPCVNCLNAHSRGAASCLPGGRCARMVCRKLYVDYPTIVLGSTWGQLPAAEQQLWKAHDCDQFSRDMLTDRCMVTGGGGACFTGTGCAVHGRPALRQPPPSAAEPPPSAAELRVPRSVREYYNGYTRDKLAPFARRVAALREAPAAVRRGACEHHCSPSNVLRGVTQVDVVLAPTATGTGVEVRAQHRTCTQKQEGYGFAPHKLVGVKRMLSHAAQSFGPEMRRALGGRPLHLYYSFYDNPRLAAGASHPLLPHLVFASTPGTLDVAVPDWTFYDYPEAQHGMPDASWATISASLRRTSSHWRRKADALFWRGSPTSSFRKVVVDALAKQPRSSDLLLDVKFAGARQHVPWTVQCQNKLLLHMAGHGPSLGLKYKFACNSTVLVPDESELGEEFFYGALEAGVTHAAVAKRADGKLYPADVLARAARLAADQGKARALAHGGATFAANYLSPEAIDYFWLAFVREHASLSRNLDTVCGSSSPRWCNTGTAGKTLRRRRRSMGSTSAGRQSATAQSAPSPHVPPPPKVDHRAVAGAHHPAPC